MSERSKDKPSSINKGAVKAFLKKKQKIFSLKQYKDGILNSDTIVLSQAITLIESNLPKHHKLAQSIIEKCLPYSGNSIRIGITGIPGAGKSTFIEALGTYLANQGKKIAVLAIDPSSQISGGSILGDKTRMEKLSSHSNAYVRPTPSAGYGGGVARKTMETIILCEAAGFDHVFVETVGVGQSETTVHSMVDFFLLLMIAGAGDELQGIKRGIMEMSDAIIINKADGDNKHKAEIAKNKYQNAVNLFPLSGSGWQPKVLTCSALKNIGFDNIWSMINEYDEKIKSNGYFQLKRDKQKIKHFHDTLNHYLTKSFYQKSEIKKTLPGIETKILENRLSPYKAAQNIIDEHQ